MFQKNLSLRAAHGLLIQAIGPTKTIRSQNILTLKLLELGRRNLHSIFTYYRDSIYLVQDNQGQINCQNYSTQDNKRVRLCILENQYTRSRAAHLVPRRHQAVRQGGTVLPPEKHNIAGSNLYNVHIFQCSNVLSQKQPTWVFNSHNFHIFSPMVG